MARQLTPEDVDRVEAMDEARRVYFERDPDRPDSRWVKPRGRVPLEVRRAQGRLRTARWRSSLDRRKAPTTTDVGMSLATALATTSWQDQWTPADSDLLRRALTDLEARGFDKKEAAKTLRRLRIKMVGPADRHGEESETTRPAIVPTA